MVFSAKITQFTKTRCRSPSPKENHGYATRTKCRPIMPI